MIEVTQSREITDHDKDTVKRAEKAAREYAAEKDLQGIGVEDEEIDYAEELEKARYVYTCGGMAVERLEEETTENEDKPRKCRKASFKELFICKDMAIGILFSVLMVVCDVLPATAVRTTAVLLVTLAFTVTAVLFIADCLLDKWMKGM